MYRNALFIILSFVVLSCGISLPSHAAAQDKIALVSLQQALNEVEEGKRTKATLKANFDAKQKQLESMKTELKKMRDDLEKQKMVLSEDALKAKSAEMQTKFMDLQNKAVTFEQELKQQEAQSAEKILASLRNVVNQLAKEKQYNLVLENSAAIVLYSANAEDITPEVIRRYNAGPK